MKCKTTLTPAKVSLQPGSKRFVDHEFECPYCMASVQIILEENMKVGHSA